MKTRKQTRTVVARVIGPVLHVGYGYKEVLWKVRIIAKFFPFHIDSQTCYPTKARADEIAEKWKGRKIEIRVTK